MTGNTGIKDEGFRTLPTALDQKFAENPNGTYAIVPKTHDLGDGFRYITNLEILKAVDSMALWLEKSFGRSDKFETLAYVGVTDIRYTLFFYAAVKAGYKVLLISPRNAPHQNTSLLEQTECDKLFHSVEMTKLALGLRGAVKPKSLTTKIVEPLDEWLSSYERPYPFFKTFEEARWDPVVVLHSSGSTGAPKPIVQTQQFFANVDRSLSDVSGRKIGGDRVIKAAKNQVFFSPFPGFHLAGFHSLVVYPTQAPGGTVVLGFPDQPPSPQMAFQIMSQVQVGMLFSPPSIIEALLQTPGASELFTKLEYVIYTGGTLEKTAGDRLSQMTKIALVYGSTEIGPVPLLLPPAEDWLYIEIHPDSKFTMEPSLNDYHELVLHKDVTTDMNWGIGGTILRDNPEYRTRDLFIPHPAKPGLWQFYGRNDDIIVLSNGEKWNPIPTENAILSDPKVSGVLTVGDGKFQAAVLIEPKDPVSSATELIEELWPKFERANRQAQAQGQILRSMVTVVEPGAFQRAPKGTIIRKTTRDVLKPVIDRLYEGASHRAVPSDLALEEGLSDEMAILEFVRACAHQFESLKITRDNDDFFVRGMDSLGVIEMARTLTVGLSRAGRMQEGTKILAAVIYEFPTIKSLANAIHQRLSLAAPTGSAATEYDHMERLFQKYKLKPAANGLINRDQPSTKTYKGLHIVLIGSTGTLGTELLSTLSRDPKVSKLTCIDRNPSSELKAKQMLSFSDDALSKVSFKHAGIKEVAALLSGANYDLIDSSDAIIHCAWQVDFNLSVSSYEPQITAVSAIASLIAARSLGTKRLFYVSSISSISSFTSEKHLPEIVPDAPECAMPIGYGRSKHVSERILATAASEADLDVTILRLGQIGGPVRQDDGDVEEMASTRRWKQTEWLPSLMISSSRMGLIPSDLPPVDWIPVNVLGRILARIISHDVKSSSSEKGEKEKLRVYNLVNPRPLAWNHFAPIVQKAMGGKHKIVPMVEWLAALKEKDDGKVDTVEKYPALKIVGYLESMVWRGDMAPIVTENTKRSSEEFRGLGPVSGAWMEEWLGQMGIGKGESSSVE